MIALGPVLANRLRRRFRRRAAFTRVCGVVLYRKRAVADGTNIAPMRAWRGHPHEPGVAVQRGASIPNRFPA
jgi:hypothetical protein